MTKNDIIRMARQVGLQPYYDEQEPAIEAFANLVAAAEREACLNCYSPDDTFTDLADKIRARTTP